MASATEGRYNLIKTNGFPKYMASLVKGNSRNLYIAIGTGDPIWDSSELPVPSPDTQVSLFNEVFRKAIDMSTAVYVDPGDHSIVSNTPTNVVRLTSSISNSEYNGVIREFGIFGIDATITQGSGTLLEYCDHNKVVVPTSSSYTNYIYITM